MVDFEFLELLEEKQPLVGFFGDVIHLSVLLMNVPRNLKESVMGFPEKWMRYWGGCA